MAWDRDKMEFWLPEEKRQELSWYMYGVSSEVEGRCESLGSYSRFHEEGPNV